MLDPTVLYAAIGLLIAIVAVQGALYVRSRRAYVADVATHKAEAAKLAEAASTAILAILKSGGDAMKKLQVKTVGATLAEIVKLEKQTGERIADMTDDRFAEVMFGAAPSFTRGKGFTMHNSRTFDPHPWRPGNHSNTMENFLRSLGMPGGPTRSEAKADVLRRGYGGDPLADLLGPGARTIVWSPGDPIPEDAPPEVKELLRSFNDAGNAAADPYAHVADTIKAGDRDDGRTFHTSDAGSAEPLADLPGGQPNGRFHDETRYSDQRGSNGENLG
jgi:hypothetical protein